MTLPYTEGSPRVRLIGDSIMVQTETKIRAALPASFGVSVWALNGVNSGYWIPTAAAAAAEPDPQLVLCCLGTNDCSTLNPAATAPAQFLANVQQLYSTLDYRPSRTRLGWFTIGNGPVDVGGVSPSLWRANTFNALIRSWPRVALLDWEAMARANPAWLSGDWVHPTVAGEDAIAAAAGALILANA